MTPEDFYSLIYVKDIPELGLEKRDIILYKLYWMFRDLKIQGTLFIYVSEYDVRELHPLLQMGIII